MLNKIRYILSTLKNTGSYLNSFNDYFLDYYLGHHKIIGWFKGHPVYSAFLTPGLSKALGNTLARRLMSNLMQKPLPGMANIAVTDKCNAKCEHCSFYTAMDKKKQKVLGINQVKEIIKSCQDFGCSVINFVGGEPLLRDELSEIISSIDKDKSSSSIFTNGWFLEEKCDKLKKSGLMMIIVSLDGTTAEKHDRYRHLPGLFEKAIKGIKKAQRIGLLTAISTTVIQDDIEDGSFEKMIHLAKRLKVNELILFDTLPVGMYSHKKDINNKKIDKKRLFAIVDKYNAKKDFPGIFCYARFRDQSTFGCSAGRNYFYISPYGEMHPCDFTAKPIGNVLEITLPNLWNDLSNMRAVSCDKYMNSCCEDKYMFSRS